MDQIIDLGTVLMCSENVVAREIEGELIIVPLTSGIGDLEDDLFTLNETGKAVWRLIDGQKTIKKIARELSSEFEAPPDEIERDLLGLAGELVKRRMLVVVPRT